MKEKENNIEKNSKNHSISCNDKKCHVHGHLKTRGRIFKGYVIKKFEKRIVIEFERINYVRKYERYEKRKTKLHARLPECMKEEVNVGDYVMIQECRPLSKIIHFAFLKKIKNKGEGK
ncbi:MAG: 30S ribosomal protein S17 [Nanoarchaeota archaeon]|nr:30S ribosomal protein S17 [Nanoarchaeota archaeon]